MAGLEFSELESSDTNANQSERGVADCCRHSTHLVVFAFDQLQFDPAVRYVFSESDRRNPRRHFRLRLKEDRAARQRSLPADGDAAL